jgi:hypothetical protein
MTTYARPQRSSAAQWLLNALREWGPLPRRTYMALYCSHCRVPLDCPRTHNRLQVAFARLKARGLVTPEALRQQGWGPGAGVRWRLCQPGEQPGCGTGERRRRPSAAGQPSPSAGIKFGCGRRRSRRGTGTLFWPVGVSMGASGVST